MDLTTLPSSLKPRDFAAFALEVYNRPAVLPTGWLGVATNELYDIIGEGYHGTAYKNGNQIIIAHRGTDTWWHDKRDDDLDIYLGNMPAQVPYANQFSQQVRTEYPDCTVAAHIGHSLGAVLSQHMSVIDQIPCIGFDSPGVSESIQDMITNHALGSTEGLTYARANTIVFNSAPNKINTLKTPIASKIYRLYPPFDVGFSGTDYFDIIPDIPSGERRCFTNQQHSMEGILACFDQTTGQPTQYSEYTPAQWPTDGEAWFRSLADNPHYWEEYFKSQHFTSQQRLDYIADELSEPTPFMQAATIHVTQLHQKVFGTTLGDDEVVSDHDSISVYKYGGGDLLKNKNLSFSTLCWESRKIKIKKAA